MCPVSPVMPANAGIHGRCLRSCRCSRQGTSENISCAAHPRRRPHEGGGPATCALSFPSCPRMRAYMDVAFAVAVVPAVATTKTFRAPPTRAVVPAKAGTQRLFLLQFRHARERGHPWTLPSLLPLFRAEATAKAFRALSRPRSFSLLAQRKGPKRKGLPRRIYSSRPYATPGSAHSASCLGCRRRASCAPPLRGLTIARRSR